MLVGEIVSKGPIAKDLYALPKDTPIIVYCRVCSSNFHVNIQLQSGMRSSLAAEALEANGFQNVSNYKGSALEWFGEQ